MTNKNEQIRLTLEALDVDSIQSVLAHLDIKWVDVKTGKSRVPTSEEILIIAEHCMIKAFQSETKMFKIGGFEAEVVEGVVGIKYIIAQSSPLSKLLG